MTDDERAAIVFGLLDEMPADSRERMALDLLKRLGGMPWLKEAHAKHPEWFADWPPVWQELISRGD